MDADGALGLKAIKGEGGLALVQSPESARYPEMPRRSISADHIDLVLPPGQIGDELAQLSRHFKNRDVSLLRDGAPPGDEKQFARVISMLRGVSGVDFRMYKPTTLRRRIARRMLLHRVTTLADYVAFLRANPRELAELQEDALINVTRFFRDPYVFEALKNSILPQIFRDRAPDQQVRIWVAGCSSGEEVYSIGMCLLEHLTGNPLEPPIQIFGTDASEDNIQRARIGLYPESITADVSPERVRRFFIKTEKGYQVTKRIRDLCIFARQNLCQDPAFSRIDLISCRNVLIYFNTDLQKRLISAFHYSLRTDGFLLLGNSETLRDYSDVFLLADRRHKIFSKITTGAQRSLVDQLPRPFFPESAPAVHPVPPDPPKSWNFSVRRTGLCWRGTVPRVSSSTSAARYCSPADTPARSSNWLKVRQRSS
jgi:two-component system CheB/CheR fusion protein